MIKKEELLMGRDKSHPHEYSEMISENLDKLLIPLNKVREAYGEPMMVASGWRPPSVNGGILSAAKHSNHMLGLAVDIADYEGTLKNWILHHLSLMKELGFYFEDFRWTRGWVHFQIVPPASGKRIFIPYADIERHPMTAPKAWSGEYDE